MINQKIRGAALLAAVMAGLAGSQQAHAALDLTTAGASGEINGAAFQQIDPQSTGTGVINSFVRIQATGSEAGYNTSGGTPLDTKGGGFTHDLLLSSVPMVRYGTGEYRQFLLDINQLNNENLLSLNQVQIFLTTTPSQTAGSVDATTGRLNTSGLVNLTSIYDMNSGGGTANSVLLNYALNTGSGSGDMFLYVPESAFAGQTGNYVILYSQFGAPPGSNGSNDGFEEWATVGEGSPVPVPVPEPATWIAGLMLFLPFGVTALRSLRKSRNVA